MKKFLALLLSLVMVLALVACGDKKDDTNTDDQDNNEVTDFKVGFIMLHDENSTYDLNFINAAKAACEKLGVEYTIVTNVPEGQECYDKAAELADAGCNIIFNVGLQQAQLAMKMSKQKVKLERSELLPKIALVAGEHLDGPITIEVPVLDNNFNYWYVGVGIKYNLSSLFKNNKKVRQAKLNMRKAQEEYSLAQEQIENGVQANYVNFLTSFTDLRTQEKSVELANQNYDVTSNRYKNDLALLTDMLDARLIA